jgi:hypothetical protein
MRAFEVALTTTAENTYKKLYQEAQRCITTGDTSNSKVSLLTSIDKALDEIIPINPFDARLALAGCMSHIYALDHDSICVYYVAAARNHSICILHIATRRTRTDPAWLREIVRSGKIDGVLQKLGIDRTDVLEETHTRFLN